MDLQYLLFLQDMRESTGNALTPFMSFMTDFIFSWVPLYCLTIFYWVFNKQAGGWIIMKLLLSALHILYQQSTERPGGARYFIIYYLLVRYYLDSFLITS